jgi:hypothetical protein
MMQVNVFASLGLLALALLDSATATLLFACDPIVARQPLGLCVSSRGIRELVSQKMICLTSLVHPLWDKKIASKAEKYMNSDRIFWPCQARGLEYCCRASVQTYVNNQVSNNPLASPRWLNARMTLVDLNPSI